MVLLVLGFGGFCFCFFWVSIFNYTALWLVNVEIFFLVLTSDQSWWMFHKCLKRIRILCWTENSTWVSIALWKKDARACHWHCDLWLIISFCISVNIYFLLFKVTLLGTKDSWLALIFLLSDINLATPALLFLQFV